MKFFAPLLHFVFHLGYLGPLVMGVLDSSFLILPFGNDFVVAGLVIHHHRGAPWYVLSAACGSTLGVLLLVLVSRRLGDRGLRRAIGLRKYEKLKWRIGRHAALAIAISGLAPPPFPFTTVIAAAGAMQYPIWRILAINFVARLARFTILAALALKFGRQILYVARSAPFEWTMAVFILLCLAASALSVWKWLESPRRSRAVRHSRAHRAA
jgi:membrane protein YqaA with SNARE-associated domain